MESQVKIAIQDFTTRSASEVNRKILKWSAENPGWYVESVHSGWTPPNKDWGVIHDGWFQVFVVWRQMPRG
jgi:hypothetical protein